MTVPVRFTYHVGKDDGMLFYLDAAVLVVTLRGDGPPVVIIGVLSYRH
jgi:hypothetical protein